MNCDSDNAVNKGFGEGYQTANDASEALGQGFKVNLQYKVCQQLIVIEEANNLSREKGPTNYQAKWTCGKGTNLLSGPKGPTDYQYQRT